MTTQIKKKSTNPFDSDSSDEQTEQAAEASKSNDASNNSRKAQLDFNFQFDDIGEPKLHFDRVTQAERKAFVSPLEQALNEAKRESSRSRQNNYVGENIYNEAVELDSSIESEAGDFIMTEESPLLSTKIIPDEIYAVNPQDIQSNVLDGPRRTRKSNLIVNTRLSTVGGKSSRRRESTTSSRPKTNKSPRPISAPAPKSIVLTELNSTHQDQEFTKDYKMIRLEEFGTAASWLILLLPYFAFATCLLLESDTGGFKVTKWGPAEGATFCFGKGQKDTAVPILPTPPDPCIYPFHKLATWQGSSLLEIEQEMSTYAGTRNITQKGSSMSRGTAFESGIISTVPPSASVFYADASFSNLTTESVAFIEKGMVSVSALLFQRQDDPIASGNDEERWGLVATSRPERLSMACHMEGTETSAPSWMCNTPRIMEILFSMPGSAIMSGRDIRVNILFAQTKAPEKYDPDSRRSYVYTTDRLYEIIDSVQSFDIDPEDILADIVQTSKITFTHTNPVATMVDIGGRTIAIVATLGFTIFWLSKMGFKGCRFACCDVCRRPDELFEIRRVMSLMESPWYLFPERWYILLLLISLILIQGPLLVVMYFSTHFNNDPSMHTAADTMVGIGVNGVLFVYFCLFEGFKYHKADVTRKYMEHQRHLTEIRRAAKYVVAGNNDVEDPCEDSILRYTADYFERHGDIDGVTSIVSLRLHHDPLSDYWADFLLPKMLLFAVGALSIWLTAFTRFHFSGSDISSEQLRLANVVYLASYVVQFVVLIIWLLLILKSSMETGSRLRIEPFLSTRPAQLAYRVIFAHVTLGVVTLATLFFLGVGHLLQNWEGTATNNAKDIDANTGQAPESSLDFWMHVTTRITQRFPYSGTAASIGLGRILFATVSIFIAAFIFLPPVPENHDNEDGLAQSTAREEKARERRDKRSVIAMVRKTHTWRVLPLPIERASAVKRMMKNDHFFQLYKSGYKDYSNLHDRGVVSVGPYIPLYCTELACWLHEASFQAYYTPKAVDWNDWTPGKMNLSSIGLRLEAAIFDETTNSQAIVATNIADQVDGEEDSIIVVAFRGSVDGTNLTTDLRTRMVPLLDQLIGIDTAPFKISKDEVAVEESDGWVWNVAVESSDFTVKCFSPQISFVEKGCMSFPPPLSRKKAPISAVTSRAMAVLSAAPVTRDTIPCVHEGFQDVYSVIRKKVIESLLPVLQRQMKKAYERNNGLAGANEQLSLVLPKIYITGHSLGGSLAQLLALDLASNCEILIDLNPNTQKKTEDEVFQLPTPSNMMRSWSFPGTPNSSLPNSDKLALQPPIAVYTYGEPRVGNRAFARLYKQRVPHTFRVATEGDPITALPHVVCSGIYKHAGLEVILDEGRTGNTLVGPTVVETLFRFHKVRTDFAAHSTDRYRDCLESAMEQHELQEYYIGHSGENLEGGYGAIQLTTSKDVPDWMTFQRRSVHQH